MPPTKTVGRSRELGVVHPKRALPSTGTIKTPYEAWYDKKPDLSNARSFGSEFYTLVLDEKIRKFDPKGLLCYFVGNSSWTGPPPVAWIPETSFTHSVFTDFDINKITVVPPWDLTPLVADDQGWSCQRQISNWKWAPWQHRCLGLLP
jgi:hypothetical protein